MLFISVPGSCFSSEGAERRGAHPLGPAREALSLCCAWHGSPGAAGGAAWAISAGRRSLGRWDVPALRRRSSGSSASCGGGMGDALARRGSSGERAGTPARPGSAAAFKGFGTVPSGKERRARQSSSLCGKMASVVPRRRSAVPRGIPVGNTGAGQSVSLCENLVNHMFKRLPPPRPDIIIHL